MEPKGIEPMTSELQTRRFSQLSYGPREIHLIRKLEMRNPGKSEIRIPEIRKKTK